MENKAYNIDDLTMCVKYTINVPDDLKGDEREKYIKKMEKEFTDSHEVVFTGGGFELRERERLLPMIFDWDTKKFV
jgi:hypothetical protein